MNHQAPPPSPVCPHCGAATRAAVGRAAAWPDDGIVAVEGIPTRLCPACGEQSWSEDVAAGVQRLLATGAARSPDAERLIPVVVFSDACEARGSGRTLPSDSPDAFVQEWATDAAETADAPEAQACKYCGAAAQPERVRTVLFSERGWIAIEGLPARVCVACGERFYDEATTWQLLQLADQGLPAGAPRRQVPCRVAGFVSDG